MKSKDNRRDQTNEVKEKRFFKKNDQMKERASVSWQSCDDDSA